MSVSAIIETCIGGVTLGSIYALVATGLSLCWGTIRVFNFAHGTLLTLSAYLAWYLQTKLAGGFLGFGAIIVIVCGFMFIFGILLEKLVVEKLIERGNVIILVILTTLAASIFLQNTVLIAFGPRGKQLPKLFSGVAKIGNESLSQAISHQEIMIIILAPCVLLFFWIFLKKTKIGAAIRSVEQNKEAASLMGIDVKWIYSLTFGISTLMAALAGIMFGSAYTMTPTMGMSPLIKAFIIVVLGGLGSIQGTILAAYVVALIEALSAFFIGLFWTPIVLFSLMIIILIIRPTGLLGEAE
jgi:branched-chain amino acid transport system permease protein